MTDNADQLSGALDQLIAASRVLDKATQTPADEDGTVDAYGDGRTALETAETSWGKALQGLFGSTGTPTLPVFGSPARLPTSKGAYLYFVDRACGRAGLALNALPDPDNLAEALRLARKDAALIRTTAARLKAVALPAADAALLQREVRVPLDGFAGGADALDALVRATQENDAAAAKAAFAQLKAADAAENRMAAGLGRYGATVCSQALGSGPPSSGGTDSGGTVAA